MFSPLCLLSPSYVIHHFFPLKWHEQQNKDNEQKPGLATDLYTIQQFCSNPLTGLCCNYVIISRQKLTRKSLSRPWNEAGGVNRSGKQVASEFATFSAKLNCIFGIIITWALLIFKTLPISHYRLFFFFFKSHNWQLFTCCRFHLTPSLPESIKLSFPWAIRTSYPRWKGSVITIMSEQLASTPRNKSQAELSSLLRRRFLPTRFRRNLPRVTSTPWRRARLAVS